MGLDNLRWGETSETNFLHKGILEKHGNDASLIFIDSSVYKLLPSSIRDKCINLDLIPLKGMGLQKCWSISILDFNIS